MNLLLISTLDFELSFDIRLRFFGCLKRLDSSMILLFKFLRLALVVETPEGGPSFTSINLSSSLSKRESPFLLLDFTPVIGLIFCKLRPPPE